MEFVFKSFTKVKVFKYNHGIVLQVINVKVLQKKNNS